MKHDTRYRNASWVDPRVSIQQSSCHGYGLFAARGFRAGEIVIIWGGVLMTAEEVRAGLARPGSIAAIDEGLYLAGRADEPEDPADLINHSCDPTMWLADDVTLVARRDIAAGQELTADYCMWEADEDWVADWECRCGSPLCRGQITGRDWRQTELQERYWGHLSPFLNARIRRLRAGVDVRGSISP